jgi:hypothetical protein
LSRAARRNMPGAFADDGNGMGVTETDLYEPVKAFLEAQGYDVKGEIRGCDVVGGGGRRTPVIVELKLRFNLALVLQGVDRLAMSDVVYLAVPRAVKIRRASVSPDSREVRRLCRRLGLGLLTVNPAAPHDRAVEVVLDPVPYQPRKSKARTALLLGEHQRRRGDFNRGGGRGVPIVTAYRQEALRCVQLLDGGARSIASLRATGLVPRAASILQRDVYGWFHREGRGVYVVSESGRRALVSFARALDLTVPGPAAE